MRRRHSVRVTPLSSGAIPSSCKMLFRCDETSGYPVNAVNGAVYNPNNLVVAGTPGSVAYEVANAIRFNIATGGVSVSIPLDVTCSTRNVLILAAHILPIETTADGVPEGYSGTRVAVGTLGNAATGDSPVLSISFSSRIHTQFDVTGTGGTGYQVSVPQDGGAQAFMTAFGVAKTIYVMWNGLGSSASVNGTITGKCLNADGTVHTNSFANVLSQTASGIIIPDTVTLGDMMRPAWAQYYKMEMWELPYLPANLEAKLAVWGDLARAGRKEAFYL